LLRQDSQGAKAESSHLVNEWSLAPLDAVGEEGRGAADAGALHDKSGVCAYVSPGSKTAVGGALRELLRNAKCEREAEEDHRAEQVAGGSAFTPVCVCIYLCVCGRECVSICVQGCIGFLTCTCV
jgi:hypothetical protein